MNRPVDLLSRHFRELRGDPFGTLPVCLSLSIRCGGGAYNALLMAPSRNSDADQLSAAAVRRWTLLAGLIAPPLQSGSVTHLRHQSFADAPSTAGTPSARTN